MLFQILSILASVRPVVKPTTKKDIHFLRKAWHVSMIVFVAYLYAFVVTERSTALFVLGLIAIPFSILDIARLWIRPLNKFIINLFAPVMRMRELNTVSSTTPFLFAAAVVIAFFPKPIAILSILCLALGDVTACVVGIKYGKDKIYKNKSLQGSLACFFVCSLITLFVIQFYQISTSYIAPLCFIGGLVPTLAELAATKRIDDNFLIPTVTAVITYPFFLLLSTF